MRPNAGDSTLLRLTEAETIVTGPARIIDGMNLHEVAQTRLVDIETKKDQRGSIREAACSNHRMCTRYISPEQAEIERFWHVGRNKPARWWEGLEIFPRSLGPFLRLEPDDDGRQVTSLVVGQFGLIPWFAKAAKLPYATQNARSEEITGKASYKQPWAKGQRCIIPAWSFDEPCWETGKNVWWRFRRANGEPWGLAGLWNTWTDRETGEIVESYTMLTVNADDHPLMSRMHKPDPKLPADQQDKRSVVAIERTDAEAWLSGTLAEAKAFLRAPAVELIEGGPAVRAEKEATG